MTIPAYMLNYHVSAGWRPRGETREQCAARAFKWFGLMRECDPSFSQWFLKGNTKAAALRHRVDLDATVFASHLEESRVLGTRRFFQTIWNGLEQGESSSAMFFVGDTGSADRVEWIQLDLPWKEPVASRVLTVARLSAIMQAYVLAWDPDHGIAITMEHLEAAFSQAPHHERIGWINYFARSRGPIPPLPSPVRTEPVDDNGTLVILGDEKLSGANPDHIALAQRVSAELKEAGVLKPLSPRT